MGTTTTRPLRLRRCGAALVEKQALGLQHVHVRSGHEERLHEFYGDAPTPENSPLACFASPTAPHLHRVGARPEPADLPQKVAVVQAAQVRGCKRGSEAIGSLAWEVQTQSYHVNMEGTLRTRNAKASPSGVVFSHK